MAQLHNGSMAQFRKQKKLSTREITPGKKLISIDVAAKIMLLWYGIFSDWKKFINNFSCWHDSILYISITI